MRSNVRFVQKCLLGHNAGDETMIYHLAKDYAKYLIVGVSALCHVIPSHQEDLLGVIRANYIPIHTNP